ncbi:MAG: hypothetical protein JWP01_74 [Myxococcales bacterium]|nr:hypothetical protein [Myxococcales bacterium]
MNALMLALMIFGGLVSATLAANKQRNVVAWLIVGALMPLISIVAIACLPSLAPLEDEREVY